MENKIQTFNFDGNDTRVVMKDGEPWWVASDVCAVLELTNPTMVLERLDEDERSKFNLGRAGDVNIINEFGLYGLILGSRKPEAQTFKRWIKHDVLPAIRRHGMYMTDQKIGELIHDPNRLSDIVRAYADEHNRRKELEAKLEHARPSLTYAKAVEAHDDTVTVGEFAKILTQNGYPIGANRLYCDFRRGGYICKNKVGRNEPTQWAMDAGLFRMNVDILADEDGKDHTEHVPRLTLHGQKVFMHRYLSGIMDDWNE